MINLLPYTNKMGGTGYYIKRILYYLQRMDKNNHYFLICGKINSPKDKFNLSNNDNFSIISFDFIDSKFKRIFFEQFILPFYINFVIKVDIFFSPSVALPLLSFNTKLITTIHDLIPFVNKNKYGAIQGLYIKSISYLSAKKANKILTVSQNSKKDIIKYLDVNEEKVDIIYNFLDSTFKNLNDEIKKEADEDYFLTVSTIQPGKNLIRLFKAYKKFTRTSFFKENKTKLYVIGKKGWNYNKIFKSVDELNLNKQIKFLGYVNEDNLKFYYNNARAFIYVSLYEGFGIPPLESLYYDCPIVISNTSSLPEVGGNAAIYVDPKNIDSITEGIIKTFDRQTISKKRKCFKQQLNKFDGSIETKKLINIINKL